MTIQEFENKKNLLTKEISNLRNELIESIAKFKVGQKVKCYNKVHTISARLFENETGSYNMSEAYQVLYIFRDENPHMCGSRHRETTLEEINPTKIENNIDITRLAFEESRLTNPMVGFKHNTFEDFMEWNKKQYDTSK